MPVWSVVKISELEGSKRLDAEYYRPEYLKLRELLSRHPTLGENVQKIIHPVEIKRVYEDQGLQILLAQNIQHNFLDFTITVFMPESVKSTLSRNRLLHNDVVMTRSGANYGDAAPYFGEPHPLYTCADDLVIRPKPNLPAGYLSTFFNTVAGRALIKRGGYGAAQPHVAPTFLQTLRVPRFSRDVEGKVDGLVILAGKELKRSELLYLQAERVVLDIIGWDKLNLSQSKWWTVQLSRASGILRLDAEHFQPKYERLVTHLQKVGKAKQLGEFASFIKRGLQPDYAEDGEILVVNSQHLGRFMVNVEATERADAKFWDDNKRCHLQRNDVLLYATGAYVGRTNVWLEDRKAVASNHVTIIRPGKSCDPAYLAVFLNAPCGIFQADQWASGSGQREIYPENVGRIWVALPPERLQQQVAKLVQESYTARQKAKALLAEAKAKVEALIEGKRL